ncbi:50S ribosomal protein L23 [Candidatus Woesearchaeota archaeon B3_Woes]|nr:MAG: 50S ribosomal protein L23 [Candidatus Woesearchaeota archaeon B3_Woes]
MKKEVKKGKEKKIEKDSYGIIKHPLSTEKSLRLMESENKLIFVVDKKANKHDIKKAIEDIFKAKVIKINTLITQDGYKRAYVKFSNETPAIDIATNMGLM